jgi:hypothetical protein
MKLPRFYISTLLLSAAIVGLTIALVQTRQETAMLRAELKRILPIPTGLVTTQFKRISEHNSLAVRPLNVRYDPIHDTYEIYTAAIDSKTGIQHEAPLVATRNTDGHYIGTIPSKVMDAVNTGNVESVQSPQYVFLLDDFEHRDIVRSSSDAG